MDTSVHRYCCGPALAMTVEVPQIHLLASGSFQSLGIWMYIDKLLMCLWLCFQLPVLLASLSLGLWTISTSLYLASISLRVHASVHGAFRSISHTVFNTWLHSGYMFMFRSGRGFWTYFLYFLREVVLGSCGRFTSCLACAVLVLLVTIRPVLCSLRLSVG